MEARVDIDISTYMELSTTVVNTARTIEQLKSDRQTNIFT
jgi:hypothetical protein